LAPSAKTTQLLAELNAVPTSPRRTLSLAPHEVTCTDTRDASEIHADAMKRGAKCEQCPLYGLHVGPVKSVVVPGRLGVLSDSPNQHDIPSGVPLTSAGTSGKQNAGQFLDEHLTAVGVARETVSIINVTECRTPENYAEYRKQLTADHKAARSEANKTKKTSKKNWKKGEPVVASAAPVPAPAALQLTPEEACAGRFQHDVKAAAAAGVNTFLVLGNNALRSYATTYKIPYGGKTKAAPGEAKISTLKKTLGCVMEFPNAPTIIPSYQPGYALMKGSRQYAIAVGRWIRRAAIVAGRGGKTNWKPPARLITNPTPDQVELYLGRMIDRAHEDGTPVYCDIETDGINVKTAKVLCIAFGQHDLDGEWTVIVIPWRHGTAEHKKGKNGTVSSKGGGNGGSHWYSLAAPASLETAVLVPATVGSLAPGEPAPTVMNAVAQYLSAVRPYDLAPPTEMVELDAERQAWTRRARPPVRMTAAAGSDCARVFAAISEIVNDPKVDLVGHNFNGFDAPKLWYAGFLKDHNRAFRCTMLGNKNSYACDMMHSLGFSAALRFEVPSWKDDANDKFIVGATDEHLHTYCGYDTYNTGVLDEAEREEHVALGAVMQNQTDVACAAIGKNMGEIGLMLDMSEFTRTRALMREKRTEHFRNLGRLVYEITRGATELKHIEQIDEWFPGNKYNIDIDSTRQFRFHPESQEMICDILFGASKYSRPHKPLVGIFKNKEGAPEERPYEVGDRVSVTAGSLIKLREHIRRLDENKTAINRDVLATQFIDSLLEYRAFTKITSTYIEGLIRPRGNKGVRVCHTCNYEGAAYFGNCQRCGTWLADATIMQEDDGFFWLHPQYKYLIPTGRWSANPTIQTYPERGKLNCRRAFIAPPGHLWVGADLDQVELRLYAIISGDTELIDVINWRGPPDKNGKRQQIDAHAWNYATIKAKNYLNKQEIKAIYDYVMKLKGGGEADKQKCKMYRNIAKRFVYLIAYGGEKDKLYETMRNDRDKETGELMFPDLQQSECERWYVNWHKAHPQTKKWQASCIAAAKKDGYVTSPLIDYRRRYFPGQANGLNQQNAAANSVIQPSAAAITNRAAMLCATWWKHREWSPYSGMNLQIHDAIGGYCPIDKADWVKAKLTESMFFSYDGMEFTAEAKYGRSWADI